MDPMFHAVMSGSWGRQPFAVADDMYSVNYFIVDGIYPPWAVFVGPLRTPTTPWEVSFTKLQEAVRKDVERLFGVVKGRWKILRTGNRIEYSSKAFVIDIIYVSHS